MSIIPAERIENKIYFIRGKKIMLDRDLAALYGVSTKAFNQAVRRNKARFPEDFMFQIDRDELESLRSQIVTLGSDEMHGKYLPYVFTEQGVAMLSGVLKSKRAILAHVEIIRTFTKLREMLKDHEALLRKLERMENKYDQQFSAVFKAIKSLIIEKDEPREDIGFKMKKK